MNNSSNLNPGKDTNLPTRRLINRKPKMSPKALTFIERIRLVCLVFALVGVSIYAYRRYQWHNATSAIYRLLENEDSRTALERLRQLDELWGPSGESSFLRGRAYRYLNNVELADRSFNQALVAKYNAERLHHEQLLLDVQCVMPQISQNVVDQVLSSYQAPLAENGTALTRGFLRLRKIDATLLVLGIWKNEEPDSDRINYLSGLLANQSQLFSDALALFEKAHQTNGNYIPTWIELAKAYWHDNQIEKAREYFAMYNAKCPDDPEGEGGLIQSMLALKEFEAVNKLFENRNEPLDLNSQARIFRAEAYLGVDQAEKALQVLQAVLREWPDDIRGNEIALEASKRLENSADIEKYSKRLESAAEARSKILELRSTVASEPANASTRYELGHALMNYESRNEGFQELQTAIIIDPSLVAAHEDLMHFYMIAGNPNAAAFHRQQIASRTQATPSN